MLRALQNMKTNNNKKLVRMDWNKVFNSPPPSKEKQELIENKKKTIDQLFDKMEKEEKTSDDKLSEEVFPEFFKNINSILNNIDKLSKL